MSTLLVHVVTPKFLYDTKSHYTMDIACFPPEQDDLAFPLGILAVLRSKSQESPTNEEHQTRSKTRSWLFPKHRLGLTDLGLR